MRVARLALTAALLLAPVATTAGTFGFHVTDGGELAADFGNEFRFFGDVESSDFFTQDASAELVAPLSHREFDAIHDQTTYTYGAGTLTLALTTVDEHGNDVVGMFAAGTLPFTFTVRENADPNFGGGITEDFTINLGPGLFDAPLAHAFGIRPETDGGTIDNFLEAILGSPDDSERTGFYAAGYADVDIDVREIPEPGLALLSAAAAAALIRRRRVRRV